VGGWLGGWEVLTKSLWQIEFRSIAFTVKVE